MSDIGQRIIDETRRVAAANPGFIYHGNCQYVRDEQPACLIGHALWNLKLIDASFEDDADNESGIDPMSKALGIQLDVDEEFWLVQAQSQQDDRATWGKSVEYANEELAKSLNGEYDNEGYL